MQVGASLVCSSKNRQKRHPLFLPHSNSKNWICQTLYDSFTFVLITHQTHLLFWHIYKTCHKSQFEGLQLMTVHCVSVETVYKQQCHPHHQSASLHQPTRGRVCCENFLLCPKPGWWPSSGLSPESRSAIFLLTMERALTSCCQLQTNSNAHSKWFSGPPNLSFKRTTFHQIATFAPGHLQFQLLTFCWFLPFLKKKNLFEIKMMIEMMPITQQWRLNAMKVKFRIIIFRFRFHLLN